MKKIISMVIAIVFIVQPINSQSLKNINSDETKNQIFIVLDGTSLSVMSLARIYKGLIGKEQKLNIDPYICGTVIMSWLHGPISDSAPAASYYITGFPSVAKYLGVFPYNYVDSSGAGQVLNVEVESVFKASKSIKKRSLGMVFTCEYTHATPAAMIVNVTDRKDTVSISNQMISYSPNLMFGGGRKILTTEQKSYLANKGYAVISDTVNNLKKFRDNTNPNCIALHSDFDLSCDFDRDPNIEPSLGEMIMKAITLLSKDKNGFTLFVEASKIDWRAHNNDVVGMISEFLAFDDAFGELMKWVIADGNTSVVVVPDHGTSGISIGSSKSDKNYMNTTNDELFGALPYFKRTSIYLAKLLSDYKMQNADSIKSVFRRYSPEVQYTKDEYVTLATKISKMSIETIDTLVSKFMLEKIPGVGFTTYGHTGEELFIAIYHPRNSAPIGVRTAKDVNRYLCRIMGVEGKLDSLSRKNYPSFVKYEKLKYDSAHK